jgi:ankyrin repeat protein
MAEETAGSPSGPQPLPDNPNLDWLRKQAKRRLDELRAENPSAQLADAQFELAKQYGFASWRALKAHIDSLTVEGQLFDAVDNGDVDRLVSLLAEHPDKITSRDKPYEWTLLHRAAHKGQLAVVNLLLDRGLDVNAREKGDNTVPLHWAAAAGHVDIARRLIEAGSDVVGHGDDHELEVIGWASCWEGTNDAAHRAVVDLLVANGARHHIFSAIALNLAGEVRRIVAADPTALNRRMSRNEGNQTPLHFAVRMERPEMVGLLLDLGADPLATDSGGFSPGMYATRPDVDRRVMEAIRAITEGELRSADRGSRAANGTMLDLVASVSLGDWRVAERLVRDNPSLLKGGALHFIAKRGDATGVKWLLDHGADPNVRWQYWDTQLTALQLATWHDHVEIFRLLLSGGADPSIRDTKYNGDARGWAEHFNRPAIIQVLKETA